MPPSEFWACDTWSVADALEGYAQSKGVTQDQRGKLTKDEIDSLKEWMNEIDD